MDSQDKMRWVLLTVFLILFVILVALTGLSIFGLGDNRPILTIPQESAGQMRFLFISEIGIAIVALFYSIFGIKQHGKEVSPPNPTNKTPAFPPIPKNGFFSSNVSFAISQAVQNLSDSVLTSESALCRAIEEECSLFQSMTADWARGEYETRDGNYADILAQVYADAKDTVFSTCDPDYVDTWTTVMGRKFVDAHKNNGKPVIRIFLFERRDDVTDSHMKVMREQDAVTNIEIYVFINEGTELDINPDISKDFTLIDDGRIIGITNDSGKNKQATFHLDNKGLAAKLTGRKERMIRVSESFGNFIKNYSPNSKVFISDGDK